MNKPLSITYKGETHTLREWGAITGINPETIKSRITKFDWPVWKALTTPAGPQYGRRDKSRVPKPEPKDKVSKCTKKCKRCFYSFNHSAHLPTCDYILITGHRRPCPAGDNCTEFTTKRKKKPNNNGLVRMMRRGA